LKAATKLEKSCAKALGRRFTHRDAANRVFGVTERTVSGEKKYSELLWEWEKGGSRKKVSIQHQENPEREKETIKQEYSSQNAK